MQKDPLRASSDHPSACAHEMRPVLDRAGVATASSSSPRPKRIPVFLIAKSALLVCVLLVSAVTIFALSSIPAKTQAYAPHAPIVINGDGEFTAENGVVSGRGAPADPYVISGWEISVSSGIGISISSTTVPFIIIDVHVNGTETTTGPVTGVKFLEVTYGQIVDCLINDTNCAADVQFSNDCSIHGNELLDTIGWAMTIQNYCQRVHVVDNHIHGQNGILSYQWGYSNVMLNEFVQNDMCISGYDSNTLIVKENSATDCGHALSLAWSTNVQVMNNQYVDCTFGVEFDHVTYSDIRGNVIDRAAETGIHIFSTSYFITISDNVVNGTGVFGGLVIEGSHDAVVTRNVISNNTNGGEHIGGGITLPVGSWNILIFNNSLIDNVPQQAEDGNGATIRWNGTYPIGGNFWSEYVGVDVKNGSNQDTGGPDGFIDEPRSIDGDSADYYPLMVPVPATVGPVAGFTVSPAPGEVNMSITFDASSSHHPNPAKKITGYRWDFNGDGAFDTSFSSNPVITRAYPMPGNYTVILEVEDEDGMTDMTTVVVDIYEEGIIPEFGTVLAPVLAVMALVVFAVRRRSPVA